MLWKRRGCGTQVEPCFRVKIGKRITTVSSSGDKMGLCGSVMSAEEKEALRKVSVRRTREGLSLLVGRKAIISSVFTCMRGIRSRLTVVTRPPGVRALLKHRLVRALNQTPSSLRGRGFGEQMLELPCCARRMCPNTRYVNLLTFCFDIF